MVQRQKYDTDFLHVPRNPEWFAVVRRKIYHLTREYVGNGLLLDLGGYDGKITVGLNSVVLDLSQLGLRVAHSQGLDVCRGDIHQLPFEDDSFQGVMLCQVLEHSPAPPTLINEVIRVLKPWGHAIIIVPNAAGLGQLLKLLRGEVKPAGNSPLELPDHSFQFTYRNLRTLLSGFPSLKLVEIAGDSVEFPFMNRLKWYRLAAWLGGLSARLSGSLIAVAQKRDEH